MQKNKNLFSEKNLVFRGNGPEGMSSSQSPEDPSESISELRNETENRLRESSSDPAQGVLETAEATELSSEQITEYYSTISSPSNLRRLFGIVQRERIALRDNPLLYANRSTNSFSVNLRDVLGGGLLKVNFNRSGVNISILGGSVRPVNISAERLSSGNISQVNDAIVNLIKSARGSRLNVYYRDSEITVEEHERRRIERLRSASQEESLDVESLVRPRRSSVNDINPNQPRPISRGITRADMLEADDGGGLTPSVEANRGQEVQTPAANLSSESAENEEDTTEVVEPEVSQISNREVQRNLSNYSKIKEYSRLASEVAVADLMGYFDNSGPLNSSFNSQGSDIKDLLEELTDLHYKGGSQSRFMRNWSRKRRVIENTYSNAAQTYSSAFTFLDRFKRESSSSELSNIIEKGKEFVKKREEAYDVFASNQELASIERADRAKVREVRNQYLNQLKNSNLDVLKNANVEDDLLGLLG